MERQIVWALLAAYAALITLIGAFLLIGRRLKHLRIEQAERLATELPKYCQKVLKDVEPNLSKPLKFYCAVEVIRLGRFPWQIDILIRLEVRHPTPKIDPIKTTVLECVHHHLDLPAHKRLLADIQFNLDESLLEK